MTPGTGTVSGVAITLNSRVGKALFSAQTPAAGATIDLTLPIYMLLLIKQY